MKNQICVFWPTPQIWQTHLYQMEIIITFINQNDESLLVDTEEECQGVGGTWRV